MLDTQTRPQNMQNRYGLFESRKYNNTYCNIAPSSTLNYKQLLDSACIKLKTRQGKASQNRAREGGGGGGSPPPTNFDRNFKSWANSTRESGIFAS
jgi:hypothetical protein